MMTLPQSVALLEWPAKSPDLSPIEQIWGLIKSRLRWQHFPNAGALFAAILQK
jgi:transposase